MVMQNKRIIGLALVTALLLSIPLIAMQFTDEANWGLFDFIFAGGLIFGTGLAYQLVSSKGKNIAYRAGVGMALAGVFLLIWINLAVGIIGSEDNPVNIMYFGVIAIGFLGSIIARLQPQGMAWVMFAMATAQMLVPVIGLIIVRPQFLEPPGVIGVFALNAFFATLFAGSGLFFRQASATPSKLE